MGKNKKHRYDNLNKKGSKRQNDYVEENEN